MTFPTFTRVATLQVAHLFASTCVVHFEYPALKPSPVLRLLAFSFFIGSINHLTRMSYDGRAHPPYMYLYLKRLSSL